MYRLERYGPLGIISGRIVDGICRNKAYLFKLICDRVGVKCKFVSRLNKDKNGGHTFNYVEVIENGLAVEYICDIDNKLFSKDKAIKSTY